MDLTAAGFGSSLTAALPELQTMAESLMTLTFRVYEPNGATTDANDYEVPDFVDKGTVRGKVQSGSAQGKDTTTRYVSVGDVERPVLEAGLHLPLDAELPTASHLLTQGWQYEVEALGPYDDTALLGRRYLVVEVPAKSFATARRLDVVELVTA